jgi:BASS family bile acid:Na+ symporter
MNLEPLILPALKASIFLNVFALGLNARGRDATYLFRNPEKLARALLSMFIVMPLFAAAVAYAFDLRPAVKIALVALAVAPLPPLLPKKAVRGGCEPSYTIGLLVAAALFSILFTPVAVDLLSKALDAPTRMSFLTITRLVVLTTLAPLGLGMTARRLAPAAAEKAAKSIAVAATALLVASVLPISFIAWPAVESLIGNGALLAITAFVLFGLVAGHILGGHVTEERTAQALATSSRHPGVAMAIASAAFPKQALTPAAVLLYLLVSAILSIPYLEWRKRRQVGDGGAPAYRNLSRSR